MKKLIAGSFFISFSALLLSATLANAAEVSRVSRTTCFKHDNYDFELDLFHADGELKAVTYGNSDWSTTGPELSVTKLYGSELLSVYSVDQGTILLEVETQILQGEDGFVRSDTEVYDCI